MTSRLITVGAGGHGRYVAKAVVASGVFAVIGFVDDAFSEGKQFWEIQEPGEVAGWEQFKDRADCWFVEIATNAVRAATSRLLHMLVCCW